jgi:hypothetical protein
VAPPVNPLPLRGCKSSPGGVLGSRNSAAVPAPCVLAMLDFRSRIDDRIYRRHHQPWPWLVLPCGCGPA